MTISKLQLIYILVCGFAAIGRSEEFKATGTIGSFNFTKAAEEKNAENLLVIKGNKTLVERYISNFEDHKGHSEGYKGK